MLRWCFFKTGHKICKNYFSEAKATTYKTDSGARLCFQIKYLLFSCNSYQGSTEKQQSLGVGGDPSLSRTGWWITSSLNLLLHWLGIPQLATQWLLPASPGTSKAALDGPYQEESVWKSTFWKRTNINQACRSWFSVNFRNVGGVSLLHSWVSWDCLLKAWCPPTSFTACREEEGTSRKRVTLFVCLLVCLRTRRSQQDEEVLDCHSKQKHECCGSFSCGVDTAGKETPLSYSQLEPLQFLPQTAWSQIWEVPCPSCRNVSQGHIIS